MLPPMSECEQLPLKKCDFGLLPPGEKSMEMVTGPLRFGLLTTCFLATLLCRIIGAPVGSSLACVSGATTSDGAAGASERGASSLGGTTDSVPGASTGTSLPNSAFPSS